MSFRWQNNHKKKKQFNQKVVKTTNKQTGDSCWLLLFLLMRFLLLQSEAPYCSPKAITTLCLTVDSRSTFGKHLEQANQNRHKSSDSPLLISCISFYNWNWTHGMERERERKREIPAQSDGKSRAFRSVESPLRRRLSTKRRASVLFFFFSPLKERRRERPRFFFPSLFVFFFFFSLSFHFSSAWASPSLPTLHLPLVAVPPPLVVSVGRRRSVCKVRCSRQTRGN